MSEEIKFTDEELKSLGELQTHTNALQMHMDRLFG